MKTVAHQIHATHYQRIRDIVQRIDQGNVQQAQALLDTARRELPASIEASGDIQAAFFLNALRKRLDGAASDTGNLYLMPDEGQQIRMFNFMAQKFPMVRFAQDQVNAAHLAEIQHAVAQGHTEILMLDIGIGSGQQLARLMQPLAECQPALTQLTIIGIEPAPDSLKTAEATLTAAAEAHHIPFRFMGIPKALEALDDADWQRLDDVIAKRTGPFLVNASFALHHTPPEVLRDQLFSWLNAHKPALLAIIEPDADFLTPDLPQRFDNAWHHYGLTFSAIDAIDATTEEKNMVKTVFFSREIQDVLAKDGQRIERFETGDMWLERIRRAGFEPYPLSPTATHMPGYPMVSITQQPGHLIMHMDHSPLVSIVAGRPSSSGSPAAP